MNVKLILMPNYGTTRTSNEPSWSKVEFVELDSTNNQPIKGHILVNHIPFNGPICILLFKMRLFSNYTKAFNILFIKLFFKFMLDLNKLHMLRVKSEFRSRIKFIETLILYKSRSASTMVTSQIQSIYIWGWE